MRVTGSYNYPLDRQIMESVQISTFPGPVHCSGLPDGKGRRRRGENPAGGARGGQRCEGELRFFLQDANIFFIYTFNL